MGHLGALVKVKVLKGLTRPTGFYAKRFSVRAQINLRFHPRNLRLKMNRILLVSGARGEWPRTSRIIAVDADFRGDSNYGVESAAGVAFFLAKYML